MARRSPRVVQHDQYSTPTLRGIETAAQAYLKGAPLVWASGKLVEASANPRDIAAFALAPATGTTDAEVIAAAARPGIRLEMSLDSAGGLGTRALAQADVGAVYGITRDAGGVWYVDVDKNTPGTNTAVRVLALIDPIGAETDSTVTDANSGAALVLVELLEEATAGQTAAA